jgi:hypothetical protein
MANPQAWTGNYTGYRLHFDVSRSSNPGANQSTYTWSAYIYATAVNYKPYSFNTSTAVAYIGGSQVLNITFTYDFRSATANTVVKSLGSGTLTVNHDSAGVLPTQYVYSTVTLAGNPGTATADAYVAGDDYYRGPSWIDADASGSVLRGDYFSNSVSATNTGSYSLLEGGFPPGIGLSGDTVSGTATTVGYYPFRLRANGAYEGYTDTGWQAITVNPRLPAFSDGSVNSSARVGIAYSDGVTASETASYSVVASPNNLPPGLSLNTSNGAITGTPTTPGTYSFKIRATNVTGSTDTATLTITAISAARVWSGTAFVSGLANVWNGTAFVSGTIKVWDGTTWRNTN